MQEDPVIKLNDVLERHLKTSITNGLYRQRRVIDSAQDIFVCCDGQQLLNFCSNDYLGLANHPDLVNAFKSGVDKYGVGSGSAHLICGHSSVHQQLEEELAEFTGRDRALLFSTGYMANMGVISALLGRGDAVFEDRLNHASLLDGGLLSGARFKRYRHADIDSLKQALSASQANHKLVVSDAVFSMDGVYAPIKQLVKASTDCNAWLMLDDAHGLGVIGKKGGGLLEHSGSTQEDVPVLMGTLGKAFGTFGAFIAGSEALIETLIQKARSYIYTTALPPALAAATRASLQIVVREDWRREKLFALVNHFRLGAQQIGLQLMAAQSAIQPVIIGNNQQTVAVSDALKRQNILVTAIRPPTVPEGSARLRITFSARHDVEHVDRLLDALACACL